MSQINYESEIDALLFGALKEKYNITDDYKLIDYLTLRYKIERYKDNHKSSFYAKALSIFVLEELDVPIRENHIMYKDARVPIDYSKQHAIENIVSNWLLRAGMRNVDVKNEFNEILKKSISKSKPYKGDFRYISAVKYFALTSLNASYGANISEINNINGIKYFDIEESLFRDLEVKYEMDLHSLNLERYDTNTVKEKDIENYLVRHLEEFEIGLKFVDRQVVIDEARIDIWARDIYGQEVLLELKTEEDKDLVWQCIHYPVAFKQKHGGNNVRMVVLAPKYSKSLLKALKNIDGVELYKYKPTICLGKVISISVELIHRK